MGYVSKRLAIDDGPSGEDRGPTRWWTGHWREIVDTSIADFVNTVAGRMDALYDRTLRAQLYNMVFSNGETRVVQRGVSYTGEQMFNFYRAAKRDAAAR
jgi:hypothetical protein